VHEATRKVVLAGTDAVVFVADSRADHADANRAAWQNLLANMKSLGLEHVPVLVQYNKRDLPDAVAMPSADRFGEPGRALWEACAKRGEGVVETFFDLVERAWAALDADLRLAEKLGIDARAFRRALAEHVGVAEPGKLGP
jgi:hypothetical protein